MLAGLWRGPAGATFSSSFGRLQMQTGDNDALWKDGGRDWD
jgi:hypothetical protein